MTLVALSAAYGAGGSRIGPELAERLGVPFVDRAIPLAVAQRLRVPIDDATAHDHRTLGWLERMLGGFVAGDSGAPAPVPPDSASSDDFRRATEEVILNRAATGEGVILGRASVVVLRDDPRALRVRLHGTPERRLHQAIELGAPDREAAEHALRRSDRAHAEYVRRFYGARLDDPSLYHLTLDSTAIALDVCVDLIAEVATGWSARR